jgi:hypothetical protein
MTSRAHLPDMNLSWAAQLSSLTFILSINEGIIGSYWLTLLIRFLREERQHDFSLKFFIAKFNH